MFLKCVCRGRKNVVKMFYFTCNHLLCSTCVQHAKTFAKKCLVFYYLRQVNEVNDADTIFVRCVCVCLSVCLSVHSRPVNQTSLKQLNLRTTKLTCMSLKVAVHVPMDSPDMTP